MKTTNAIKRIYQTTGGNRELFVDTLSAATGISMRSAGAYYNVLRSLATVNPKTLLDHVSQEVVADNGATEFHTLINRLCGQYSGKRSTITQYANLTKMVCSIDHTFRSSYYETHGDQQTPWVLTSKPKVVTTYAIDKPNRKRVINPVVHKRRAHQTPIATRQEIRKMYDQYSHLPCDTVIGLFVNTWGWKHSTANTYYYKCANNTFQAS